MFAIMGAHDLAEMRLAGGERRVGAEGALNSF